MSRRMDTNQVILYDIVINIELHKKLSVLNSTNQQKITQNFVDFNFQYTHIIVKLDRGYFKALHKYTETIQLYIDGYGRVHGFDNLLGIISNLIGAIKVIDWLG